MPSETGEIRESTTAAGAASRAARWSKAPNGLQYAGEATYDRAPAGYPAPELQGTYFYYFAFDPPSMRSIGYIYHSRANATADDYNAWIADARKRRKAGEKSDNPDDINWDRPSYLALAVDAEGWDFFDEPRSDKCVNRSLYFNEASPSGGGSGASHCKNTTFFNAITLRDGVDLPILQVENHHLKYGTKRRREARDRDDWDYYKFDVYFQVAVQPPAGGTDARKLTMVIDPTGKNTGP